MQSVIIKNGINQREWGCLLLEKFNQEIKDLIQKYFGALKIQKKQLILITKFQILMKIYFFLSRSFRENIRFSIWNKDEFKKVNTIKNYHTQL